MLTECQDQTDLMTNIGLVWVQSVYKGYKQMTI